jgi:hypothetical protein
LEEPPDPEATTTLRQMMERMVIAGEDATQKAFADP